jgi:hypothetical protein
MTVPVGGWRRGEPFRYAWRAEFLEMTWRHLYGTEAKSMEQYPPQFHILSTSRGVLKSESMEALSGK